MKNNKKGFTLMELLAVVLIIGVLTAIAMPMYTTSVQKARITSKLLLMKGLQEGVVQYYTANSKIPAKITYLPINKSLYENIDEKTLKEKNEKNPCTVAMDFGGNEGKDDFETNSIGEYLGEISMNCNLGWSLHFNIVSSANGIASGDKYIKAEGANGKIAERVANSAGWEYNGGVGGYIIR